MTGDSWGSRDQAGHMTLRTDAKLDQREGLGASEFWCSLIHHRDRRAPCIHDQIQHCARHIAQHMHVSRPVSQ
jgi:hypothetical protein